MLSLLSLTFFYGGGEALWRIANARVISRPSSTEFSIPCWIKKFNPSICKISLIFMNNYFFCRNTVAPIFLWMWQQRDQISGRVYTYNVMFKAKNHKNIKKIPLKLFCLTILIDLTDLICAYMGCSSGRSLSRHSRRCLYTHAHLFTRLPLYMYLAKIFNMVVNCVLNRYGHQRCFRAFVLIKPSKITEQQIARK